MLAKTLLIVDFKGGNITPSYLFDLELPEQIISIFKENEGKKLKTIRREIKNFESGRSDYKRIRGLAELIKRKCEFAQSTNLDAVKIRRKLFERGFVIDENERSLIVQAISEEYGTLKQDIEKGMFADLEEEHVLTKIGVLDPEKLVQEYNLSLTQTLLFNATEMTFTVDEAYQQVYRTINYLGLMYETDGTEIKVNGPVSLIKNTKRYGSSFAKLIPYIIKSNNWSIEAKIEMERGNELRIFTFNLNSKNTIPLPTSKKEDVEFDSEVEEQFYKAILLHAPDWEIKREPTFIKAGNHVIIPDFGFYKGDITIYLEVVGFWTPEYIQKKIKKLNQTETKIIVAVNQNLKCSRADFPDKVIFYKKRIPVKPILEILKREEEKRIEQELSHVQNIQLKEKIVDLESKAKELNINPKTLEQLELPGYFIVGKKVVSQDFLDDLSKEIGQKRQFSEIKGILDKYNLTDKALELIGYKIVWNGLTPIKIVRIE